MNIFCIDCPYTRQLEALGHKVFAPDFPPGVVYLPGILTLNKFEPDLVIQHERLSARVILGGLEYIKCPTVFVSVDSHLNMFWHKYYGRLFDMVLTPHVSVFNSLPKEERLPQVRRFGPGGHHRLFKRFDRRRHDISFAGVLTEHRPGRSAMVQLLTLSSKLNFPDKLLPHEEMLDLFQDSRMVPNEAIAREVNFRMFEAASCGSLVLCQNIGEDQNAHFEPGVEFETYEHALELVDKINFYKNNPDAAEAMGKAAWERVQGEHLPEHRAAQLAALSGAALRRLTGREAAIYFWLTLAQMARQGTHPLPVEWFLSQYRDVEKSPLAEGMKLRLLMEGAHQGNPLYNYDQAARYRGEAAEMIRNLLGSGACADSLDCNLAGAMAALVLQRPAWAKAFWERQAASIREGDYAAAYVTDARLESPYDHYMAWGKLLMSLGRDANVGFNFRSSLGYLPSSAFECVAMAQAESTSDRDSWLLEMHRICERVPGFSYWDMGILAEISLKYQDNWRHQLAYGFSSLANYRIEAGIFELMEGKRKAGEAGEEQFYESALEALPSSGYILSALRRG